MEYTDIKRVITNSYKIPSHLYSEIRCFNRRKKTHSAVIDMIADVLDEDAYVINRYYNEVKKNKNIIKSVSNFGDLIGHYTIPNHSLLAYLTCRVIEPDIVVETGVYKGSSSALILQAMENNNKGTLFSIDLPGTEADPVIDSTSPYGTVKYELSDESEIGDDIPEHLTQKWDLNLGRSDEVLEPLLNDIGTVDIFMHDSDHSYENMMYEFNTVYNHLSKDGVILSDDIDWNKSFEDFSESNAEKWTQLTGRVSENIVKNSSMVGISKI